MKPFYGEPLLLGCYLELNFLLITKETGLIFCIVQAAGEWLPRVFYISAQIAMKPNVQGMVAVRLHVLVLFVVHGTLMYFLFCRTVLQALGLGLIGVTAVQLGMGVIIGK